MLVLVLVLEVVCGVRDRAQSRGLEEQIPNHLELGLPGQEEAYLCGCRHWRLHTATAGQSPPTKPSSLNCPIRGVQRSSVLEQQKAAAS